MFRTALRTAAVPLVAATVLGCSDRVDPVSPTAPALREQNLPTASSVISMGHIVKRTVTLTSDVVASAVITPAGGFISMEGPGVFLYFPAGAVSSDLTITVTAYNGNKVIYGFEPHGTVFNVPVYVGQSTRYTEVNTPRGNKTRPNIWAGYLQNGLSDVLADGTGLFSEVLDAFYYGKGNDAFAIFTINHFSGYALASGNKPTPSDAY